MNKHDKERMVVMGLTIDCYIVPFFNRFLKVFKIDFLEYSWT